MVARATLLSTGRSLLDEAFRLPLRLLEPLRARIAAGSASARDLEVLIDLRPPRMWWESRALWRAGGRAREREWIPWCHASVRMLSNTDKVQISPIPLPKGGQINR